MMFRRILLGVAFAGALSAQTFIQMSDTQFGMYTSNKSFDRETANFEFAVASANRVKPAFVVVTGDLVNQDGDAAQIAEYKRIAGKLDPGIKLYNVPGNHDVGNTPTAGSLAKYREHFGPDYFSFRVGSMAGFVLNSNLMKAPQSVPEEADKMEAWLRAELAKARAEEVRNLIVFQHHPFFTKTVDEPEQYSTLPVATRQRYLKLFHEYGVRYVFVGHDHRNYEVRDGDLTIVVSGPVGKPLNGAKSGIRIITVTPDNLQHAYRDFGDLP